MHPKRLIALAVLAVLAGAGISLLAPSSAAQAQTTPWPVTLTLTGPPTALSGQEVTYRVEYRLLDPATVSQTGFLFDFPENTTYVSSGVVSGPEGILLRLEEGFFVQWGGLGNAEEHEGAVEITVRIDPEFVGAFAAQALEPGTFTAFSNVVETQVFAPGALPHAGEGWRSGSQMRVGIALMAGVGVVLLCIGATARMIRRST
ncbi:MAG: hypothetical protein IIC91_05440 [Chloroflexi bacterium]|nr:hypothetical protein [Chloroflexota bacterium]